MGLQNQEATTSRKKVLFLITKSNWGGAQRYVFDLATNLPKDQFEVKAIFGRRDDMDASVGPLAVNLSAKGIQGIFIPDLVRDISITKDLRALRILIDIFKKENADGNLTVHLNSSKAGGLGALAARLAGVKNIVFTSHGLAWDEDRNLFVKSVIYLMSQLTFALSHHVITISKDTHRRVPKSILIYNGIQKIDFRERDEARRKIMGQAIKDVPWIGTIGEFTRNKGYPYLIKAASILKERGLSFRMSLIGWGEDLPKIKQQAIDSGLYNIKSSAYIDLPGFVPDVGRDLKAFEIFVLASVKEGLPYVLLEAGQAGCAVIGSRIPGITDILGEDGIYIEPKDSEAIANALEKLLRDSTLRQTLGEKLKERVERKFSLEEMVSQTVALYS
ncbi:MAG: glycosyltransferase family 4 protein [bacterium]|nr:glycosyltransferase family 4 protein [bacterium]